MEEPTKPFDRFVWLLKDLMHTCRAFGLPRDTGAEVLANEIRRVCDENGLDVCVSERGKAPFANDGVEIEVGFTPRGMFNESISEAVGGKLDILEVDVVVENALRESGLTLEPRVPTKQPPVTVSKTEAGNLVFDPPKDAGNALNGKRVAELVVGTDTFKHAVRDLIGEYLKDHNNRRNLFAKRDFGRMAEQVVIDALSRGSRAMPQGAD